MKSHALVTFLAIVALLASTLAAGILIGAKYFAWTFLDYATVERRMREVFCEQAMRNEMLKKCDPTWARWQEGS